MNNAISITIKERLPVFASAILFSFLANAFPFLNWNPRHDAINHTFFFAGQWEVSLGRFLQPYYGKIRGDIASTWYIGIIGTFFIALSVCIIIDLIEIRNLCFRVIISGILVANFSITEVCGTFLYVYDCFMIALFLACLSAWIWIRLNKIWKYPLSCLCLVVSLALYQAYISVTIVLFAYIFIREAYRNTLWKILLTHIFSIIILIIIGGGIYYVTWQYFLTKWEVVPANTYNGLSQMTLLSIDVLINHIISTYKGIYELFFSTFIFDTVIICIHFVIIMCVAFFVIFMLVKKNLKFYNSIIILLGGCIMPLCANVVGLLSGLGIELRCSWALFLCYPICFAIIESFINKMGIKERNRIIYLFTVIGSIVIIGNIKYSNGVYVYSEVIYQKTTSIMTRVLDNMEKCEGYKAGETQVAVLGNLSHNEDYYAEIPKQYTRMVGISKIGTTTAAKTYKFWELLGTKINGITDSSYLKEIQNLEIVKGMPCYPYNGYCKVIDDIMIVKLSE